MDDIDEVLSEVGPQLRRARLDRELTLATVSGLTGIGVSTLSRLESGERRPSLDVLLPLARVYGVPLDDLVGAPPSGDPRIHPRPIRRGGRVYIPLSHNAGGVQAVKCIIPGRTQPQAANLSARRHRGFEWFYVLSGTARLQLGDRVTVVEAGQAAEFDCRFPHVITSANDQPVELLSLFSAEGERIHVQGD